MYYYLNYFFVFSCIGHLIETVIFKIYGWSLESGFLYGYWTPIYGIGVVLILFVYKNVYEKLKINHFLKLIVFSLIIGLLLTLIEFTGGNLIETIFNREFWNYSNHKYHLGKYIALDMSCMWIICSVGFIYLIRPWMDILIKKIPKFVTYIFIVLMIIDIICTILIKSKV